MTSPLISQNRRLAGATSTWVRQFACEDIDCLIICRGPIRKEVMDVLTEMGANYGILLSEKDSITYQNALAPELRLITDPTRIHRVPDYSGATKEEREERIQQIIKIAQDNGHNAIFAGYGFMAEDESLVQAIEASGLTFIGPCSRTVRQAGLKDEAKRTALAADVSVVPGVDNLTVRTLLAKSGREQGLEAIAKEHGLVVQNDGSDEARAEALLSASYEALVDIITIEDIARQAQLEVIELFKQQPANRIRLKAIGGGGGKGQRILRAPDDYQGNAEEKVTLAAERVPELLKEVLNEVKATGRGDNKNVLIELNIETTRHQEIQVIGNGDWCLTLGGRDCSLQMHEQKLLELSTTVESLQAAIEMSQSSGDHEKSVALQSDLDILQRMEDEATRFGTAVGLDSVSTFECIVDQGQHFFMEMNTRIQVEHRVSELCYGLKFSNPENPEENFIVNSLVEAMAIIAWHKNNLPKPVRVPREAASVEARLNATNAGLTPHAGGLIEYWSSAVDNEIRDDQGICVKNPDTGKFIKYRLAGAYDSNVALILTTADDRVESLQRMAEVLRRMTIDGQDVETNLEFHYGLVHWFLAQGAHAKATTAFIEPYLTLTAQLYQQTGKLDLVYAYQYLRSQSEFKDVFDRKQTLILRPLLRLISNPHLLMGWIAKTRIYWTLQEGKLKWLVNPFKVLAELYHYLNMNAFDRTAALEVIWDHDDLILQQGVEFYQDLESRIGLQTWDDWEKWFEQSAPSDLGVAWEEIQAAHHGFQLGLELLSLVSRCAEEVNFDDLHVQTDLNIAIPEGLKESQAVEAARKILEPPPAASSNEIVAQSGGMFYAQETPGAPNFLEVGTHFDVGDPLYIIEVMKMFNKVYAEFSGTVTEVLVESGDGVIVSKGQPLYTIEPDVVAEEIDINKVQSERQSVTLERLGKL